MSRLSASMGLLLLSLMTSPLCTSATLHIQDGTQVIGEVVCFSNGTYRVQSPTLGILEINQSQIKSIDYDSNSASITSPQVAPPAGVQGIKQILMQNQSLFAMIQALQNDPQLMAAMKDPQIMQAIATGDTQTLLNNAAFMRLMQNPQIQRITREARGVISGGND